MKRKFLTLLTITTALLMWSFNAFAEGKVAPVTNNTTVMNGMAPDGNTTINVEAIKTQIQKIFDRSYTAYELLKNKKNIEKIKGVVKVDIGKDDGVMQVTLSNNNIYSWYNPLFEKKVRDRITKYEADPKYRNGKTIWIGNGLHDEESVESRTKLLQEWAQNLRDYGFDVTYSETWNDSLAFNSDIVLYHGHGASDGNKHQINTGVPLNETLSSFNFPTGMTNGKEAYGITEDYIKNKSKIVKRNSCFYLGCCNLLDGNDNMAKAFIDKGAAAVVAYWGKNWRTAIYGVAFLDHLAKGETIAKAFNYLQSDFNGKEQRDYAGWWQEFQRIVTGTKLFGGETFKVLYRDDKYVHANLVYNQIAAREELERLYYAMNGDTWADADKKNWLSDLPVTKWAGVSASSTTSGIFVKFKNTSELRLPSNLKIENFKRIEAIDLPQGSKVNDLSIKDCPMLSRVSNCEARNIVAKSCPKLENVKSGEMTTSLTISECDKIRIIHLNSSPELKTISISKCKSLTDFQYHCHEKAESKLSTLNIEDCESLEYFSLSGCSLSGTLDLSKLTNIKSVFIDDTNINNITLIKSVESLRIANTPIFQTYESIPGWEKHYYNLEAKFHYYSYEDEGRVNLAKDIYYKQMYKDGHGFYHVGEPKNSKYWDTFKWPW